MQREKENEAMSCLRQMKEDS